jgi:hypothetical protein
MNIVISITDPKQQLGLQRALAAQNAQRSTPLTTDEFVQGLVADICAAFARQHLVTQMDRITWLKERFTQTERAAIRQAAMTNGGIADLCSLVDGATVVHFDDPVTIGGVAALEAAGLIAPGRGAEILAM